ncbi:MAG: two-component system chemotaxis response regulator CheY [Paraglaciecola sp.]|jgi:two-component system chemotaxis response regulator CheY
MAKVLIIDDSRAMIMTVTMVLQKAGHEVTGCSDATKAADIALTDKFDAILCDISMPSHSGLEVVRELRELDGYRDTPILMLTADSSTKNKMFAKKIGATGWIIKPFLPERLISTINKVI